MKLLELIGYKNHPVYKAAQKLSDPISAAATTSYEPETMGKLIGQMRKIGWHKIGKGSYANVFRHPRYPYVVKVFYDDEMYAKYYALIRRMQDNPHVPKTRGNIIKLNDKANAVRLEDLEPLQGSFDPILRKYIDPRLPGEIYYLTQTDNFPFLMQNWPELSELIQHIYSIREYLDLSYTNAMKRGQTLVITDPVA